MRRAATLILLLAILAPSFPVPLIAQETGSSTPPVVESATTTEPIVPLEAPFGAPTTTPEVATSTPEVSPEDSEAEVQPMLFQALTTAPPALEANEQFLINQDDANDDIVFEGAAGFEYHPLEPLPAYTATHTGAPTKVRLYLARNTDEGLSGRYLALSVKDTNGQHMCTLISIGETVGSAQGRADFAAIPVGVASDIALQEYDLTGTDCFFVNGVTYAFELNYRVPGDPRWTNGIIYTKGADSDNEFFLQIIGNEVAPPPTPETRPGERFLFNTVDTSHDIVFAGAAGGSFHPLEPYPTYTAIGSGEVSRVRLYMARNRVNEGELGGNNILTIDLLEPGSNNRICTLLRAQRLPDGPLKANYDLIPIGGPLDMAVVEFTAPQSDCIVQEGVPYTVLLNYNVGGDPRATDGTLYFKGSDATNHFFLQVLADDGASMCIENCNSSVLFLPGIEGSRLYQANVNGGTVGGDDKLWEPGVDGLGDDGNEDIQSLFLSGQGRALGVEVYAKEKDIIERTPAGADIYNSFAEKMDELSTGPTKKINDWTPIAYDWRLSLEELLARGHKIDNRIYYAGANAGTSTPYIIQELKRLASTSKTGKVTIIAHSNGGLLAKALTDALGPNASAFVDKMIFVAVPQAGAPNAIASGLHGYDQNLGWGLINSKQTARAFASTSPMFYHLLPSEGYFTYVDDPVVTFDTSLPEWRARYGNVIHSEGLLDTFLADSFGRVPATGNENQPIQLKQNLLNDAHAVHDQLDAWVPPSGVQLIQLAGWGVDRTLSGVTYTKKGSGIEPEWNQTIDGDGTVPVPSALWTSASSNVTNYWVNLERLNKEDRGFRVFPYDHGKILAANSTIDFIADTVTEIVRPINDYIYLSSAVPSPSGQATRLRYSLHSPLTLDLYDNQGRHTGRNDEGQVEEEIPGTYYSELGDVKYLFVDPSVEGSIVMDGYAAGTFTFTAEQFDGDTQTGSVAYTDVPTTPTTVVTIEVEPDLSQVEPLAIDQNGDGQTDVYTALDGGTLSITQLILNLKTAVNALSTTKPNQKVQLLNKITNIEQKIAKQKQKQSNILAKLQAQVAKKAGKGKIDTATANSISVLLDELLTQSTLIPLEPGLIKQLKDQINGANITVQLKTNLLNKVVRLESLMGVSRSLNTMTQAVVRKSGKGILTDVETQNLLNLLDQLQAVI